MIFWSAKVERGQILFDHGARTCFCLTAILVAAGENGTDDKPSMPPEDVFKTDFFASLYNCVNPWSVSDDFYVDRAVEGGGPMLDLGCGTGMLACGILSSKKESCAGIHRLIAVRVEAV